MSVRLAHFWLAAALLAGLLSTLVLGDRLNLSPALTVFIGGLGLLQLLYAVALAAHAIRPNSRRGRSPLGNALGGSSLLLLSLFLWGYQSWSPVVVWSGVAAIWALGLSGAGLRLGARAS